MFLLFTLLFIVAISAYITFRFEGFFHKLLSLGVILTLFSGAIFGRSIVVSGIVFLAILLLLTIVYGVIAKNISISDRISILALSSILLISSWSKLYRLHIQYSPISTALQLYYLAVVSAFTIVKVQNSPKYFELTIGINSSALCKRLDNGSYYSSFDDHWFIHQRQISNEKRA